MFETKAWPKPCMPIEELTSRVIPEQTENEISSMRLQIQLSVCTFHAKRKEYRMRSTSVNFHQEAHTPDNNIIPNYCVLLSDVHLKSASMQWLENLLAGDIL